MQQRPWQTHYPADFPHEIATETLGTLVEMFAHSFRAYSERTAAVCLGESLSYARLHELSRNFAIHLQQAGLQPGDRLALMVPNSLAYLIAMTGALQAGLVVVNVNPLYTARELLHQLSDSGARCLVIAEAFVSTFASIAERTQVEHVLVAPVVELFPGLIAAEAQARDGSAPHGGFLQALVDKPGASLAAVPLGLDDTAFLQYTGGTTGVSKGAVLSHRNIGASLRMLLLWLVPPLERGQVSIVLPLPLYHVYPLAVSLLSIASGAQLRLIPNPRDLASVLAELRREPFDMFMGVNTLFNSLVDEPGLRDVDFSRTSFVIGAGASVQQAVVERWIEAGGVPITEAYGLTETSPCALFNPRGHNGSIGIPMPSTQVRLVDEDGEPVALGVPGELLLKGPQVFAGYWQNPEETRKAFTEDGWFRTGDVVVMADDGFMRIVDRKKDMILVSGFNVYPNEIEAVVAAHPGVAECACIGVADARSGEVPHLFVVPRVEGLTVEQIRTHCSASLTAYKVPRHVTFTDALPKSPIGKILRKDLRP